MNKPFVEPRAAQAAKVRRAPPLWLLALLTLSGTLGMHIFAPALSSAARDFGVGAGAMQATISLYILGLAVGQLVYGPLSDRFGRRPTLMGGLALYTIAGAVAALAPSVKKNIGPTLRATLKWPERTAARNAKAAIMLTRLAPTSSRGIDALPTRRLASALPSQTPPIRTAR